MRDKDVSQLQAAITKQPVCVGVAANRPFMHYSSGVLDTHMCGHKIDHAITAVGLGKDSKTGQNYFIVRNSWGADWGEKGYIRISSDIGGYGVCGILGDSSYPETE